ncbi:MAG: hypothetical protein LUC97_09955 [Clostridiales bacterium]|nr:hypothetical protein [Clostridiales bacterium]
MNIYLDFEIRGKCFDVEEINGVLGFMPGRSSDLRYNFRLSRLEEKMNPSERDSFWEYKTEKTHTDDVNIQIGEFLSKFEGKTHKLFTYFKTCEYMPVLRPGLIISPDEENKDEKASFFYNRVNISGENIKKLAELNCEIYFD